MVIVHTSGSTSEPKGVIHQHGPLIRHLELPQRASIATRADDVLFSNSPFFWIGGFAYSFLATLLAGATLVCSNATDAAETLDLLERTRPTMGIGFAEHRRPPGPRSVVPGARPHVDRAAGNLWPIMPPDLRPADPELRHNMLGMTEAGSVCLASDDDTRPARAPARLVRPAGARARVEDRRSGDRRRVRRRARSGELWLRGPCMMEGYYGRERHETFTPDGWYRSGDLMHVDADGFHYFTGRRGDMIKTTSGANVAPREVEAAIADATGLVAHVVGVEDSKLGQLVAAAVRVPEGQAPPDEEELRVAPAGAPLGVQDPEALPLPRRRRGADAVEREARHPRARRSCCERPDRTDARVGVSGEGARGTAGHDVVIARPDARPTGDDDAVGIVLDVDHLTGDGQHVARVRGREVPILHGDQRAR